MIRDKLLRALVLITDLSGGIAPLGVKLSAVDLALLRSTLDDVEAIAELKQNETDGIGRTPPVDPNVALKNEGKKPTSAKPAAA